MRHPRLLYPCFLLLMLATCTVAGAQSSLGLPSDSPVYEELEHFRALGVWRGGLELRPLSRGEVFAAMEAIAAASDDLTEADRRRLGHLRDYCLELGWNSRPEPEETADGGRRHPPVLWEPSLSPQFVGTASDLDTITALDRRPRLDGLIFAGLDVEVAERLAVQFRAYEDYSHLDPHPGDDNWTDNLPGDARGTLTDPRARLDIAVLGYANSWLHLRAGRENRRWGQGRRGTLFLSENPFPLDGLSLRVETRYLAWASLFAQSQRGPNPPSYEPGVDYPVEEHVPGDAYVAAHRLEIRPPGPATIALYEAVAYGGRGIDLGYANPASFFLAVTQDIWDRAGTDDKKVLGFDLRLDLAPFTVYGEFLIDRVVTLDSAEEGEEAQISSYGQLLGLRWANPLGLAGADLDLEYAHLDPQVYFHHDRDIRRALVTDDGLGDEGRIIGHWLGPNADQLHLALALPAPSPLPERSRLRLVFEQSRWGFIDGLGGKDAGFIGLLKGEKSWITGEKGSESMSALSWERWGRPGNWPGDLRLRLTLARIQRTGALSGSGWQAEIRLKWLFKGLFWDI